MAERLVWFEWETYPEVFRWVENEELNTFQSSRSDPATDAPYLLVPKLGGQRQEWKFMTDVGHANPTDDVKGQGYLASEPKYDKMFHEFASTPLTQSGMLTFAKEFGHLGLAKELGSGPDDNFWYGEPLRLWENEIQLLRFCLDISSLIAAGDCEKLREHIRWSKEWSRTAYYWPTNWKKVGFRWDEIRSVAEDWRKIPIGRRRMGPVRFDTHPLVEPSSRPAWSRVVEVHRRHTPFHGTAEILERTVAKSTGRVESRNVIGASSLFLAHVTNSQLERLGVRMRLIWDYRREQLCHRIVPQTLLGFIWQQFAQYLDVYGEPNVCVVCGRKLLKRRAHAKTCGATCRSTLRHREDKYKKLAARG